jgi:putative membrane protein
MTDCGRQINKKMNAAEPFSLNTGLTAKAKGAIVMKNLKLAFSSLFLLIPAAVFAWNNAGCAYGGRFGYMGGGFYGGGIVMGIVSLALFGILIFFGIKYLRNSGALPGKADDPLNVLKTRYAKGEITKEEFESIKKDIGA